MGQKEIFSGTALIDDLPSERFSVLDEPLILGHISNQVEKRFHGNCSRKLDE